VADDLWLFDGFNVLHAGPWEDVRELRDALASFVALRGAQGIARLLGVSRSTTRSGLRTSRGPSPHRE